MNLLPLKRFTPRLTESWAEALVAYADLCNKHPDVLTFDTALPQIVSKETNDEIRQDITESWLAQGRSVVAKKLQDETESREAYDCHLQHFTSRFQGLYDYSKQPLDSIRYVSFYTITRECYSPAEGGCWFDRHSLVATFPRGFFGYFYTPESTTETLMALAMSEAGRMGLNYDAIRLERFPAEHQTLKTPRYE